ncbi:MAG: hypothetical protein NTX49_05885 [Chlamydiae bacterium]|nr:hypothetical protein [Chlamydiota bacterium]
MNSIINHTPYLTSNVIKTLFNEGNKKYIEIKPTDLFLQKTYKTMGNIAIKSLYRVALLVVAITLPFFLIADLIYSPFRAVPLPDCHYQFKSKVFSTYFDQLKKYIDDEVKLQPQEGGSKPDFDKEVTELINFIQKAKPTTWKSKLNFHEKLLDKLRILLNKKDSLTTASVKFLQDFSKWIYTGPQLLGAMTEFLSSEILPSTLKISASHLNKHSLCDFLEFLHKEITKNKTKYPSISGAPRYYDAHRLGDTPSMLFEISFEGKKTQFIRTPAVTMDIKRDSRLLLEAAVVPEFLGLLDEKEPHLYVNLMDRTTDSEQIRSAAIEKLQDQHPLKNFHSITLDKDSSFYKQNGTAQSLEATKFKTKFLNHLFTSPSFLWPPSLSTTAWNIKCHEVIDNIHTTLFANRQTLSTSERKDFIEIAYCHFVKEAIKVIKPSTCNISCRSTIDRGASMLAGFYADHLLETQGNLTSEDCLKISAIALTPAILTQNRAPFKERTNRLICALKRIIPTPK